MGGPKPATSSPGFTASCGPGLAVETRRSRLLGPTFQKNPASAATTRFDVTRESGIPIQPGVGIWLTHHSRIRSRLDDVERMAT